MQPTYGHVLPRKRMLVQISHQVQADQLWQRSSSSAELLHAVLAEAVQAMECQVAQVSKQRKVAAEEEIILAAEVLRRQHELRQPKRQPAWPVWQHCLQSRFPEVAVPLSHMQRGAVVARRFKQQQHSPDEGTSIVSTERPAAHAQLNVGRWKPAFSHLQCLQSSEAAELVLSVELSRNRRYPALKPLIAKLGSQGQLPQLQGSTNSVSRGNTPLCGSSKLF